MHSISSTGTDLNHTIFETHTKANKESDLKWFLLANSIKNDGKIGNCVFSKKSKSLPGKA